MKNLSKHWDSNFRPWASQKLLWFGVGRAHPLLFLHLFSWHSFLCTSCHWPLQEQSPTTISGLNQSSFEACMHSWDILQWLSLQTPAAEPELDNKAVEVGRGGDYISQRYASHSAAPTSSPGLAEIFFSTAWPSLWTVERIKPIKCLCKGDRKCSKRQRPKLSSTKRSRTNFFSSPVRNLKTPLGQFPFGYFSQRRL